MHWKELYNLFLKELTLKYGMDEAVAISRLSFEEIAGKDRFFIQTHRQEKVENDVENTMLEALKQLLEDVPVQYVTGKAWFRNLHFKVTTDTLIPRPETEELVQLSIDYIKKYNKNTVLDIGTGTGCIPISIKKECENVSVSAIDFSKAALLVAKENAVENNTPIDFIWMDFLEENNWNMLSKFDVIISNPPYIPLSEKKLLDKNVVAHEPSMALFVEDDNPLIFYEKIAAFAKNHLAENGIVFVETHWQSAYEVAAAFIERGLDATVKKDFFEKERMVMATRRQ